MGPRRGRAALRPRRPVADGGLPHQERAGPAHQSRQARLLGRAPAAGRSDPAAAADRARAAEGRGEPGRVDAAAGPGPPPRRQELRRLPQPLRFDRPGLRELRPDRRTAARRTWAAGRSKPPRPSPTASSGRGWRACATTCATSGRTISSITCAGRCFRTRWAAACCRRTRRRSTRCGPGWRRTGIAFDGLVEAIVDDAAVSEQAGRDDPREE